MNASPSHASPTSRAAAFPFAALLGQSALQEALLLAAVDPGIGGVLVSGPRGTAKSTAARALAELLPEGQFVTLPLNASEERLAGTLDLQTALRDSTVRFAPGLLAAAHRGVLYVDEVNLLPDALVDALLDAAASGVNTVERDGVSHSHAANFVLIGTMNPEEGELRPQLTDRFGLMVALENCYEPQVRQRIVKARLAFDADPQAFRAQYAVQQQDCVERIRAARAMLPALHFDDAVHEHVSALCIAAQVDGLRADLVMLRAARALAAFEGADAVTLAHVDRVSGAVLLHRQRQQHPHQHEHEHAQQPRQPQANDAGETAPRATADSSAAPRAPQDRQPAGRDAHAHRDQRSHGAGADPAPREPDWGYLPPEPAGTTQVKRVIPLPLKKP